MHCHQKLPGHLHLIPSIRLRMYQLHIVFIQLIGSRLLSPLLCLPQLAGRRPSQVSSAPFPSLSLLSPFLKCHNSMLRRIPPLHLHRCRRPLDSTHSPVPQLKYLCRHPPLGMFHHGHRHHRSRRHHVLYPLTWSFPLPTTLHYPGRQSSLIPQLLTILTSHIPSYQFLREPQRTVLAMLDNRKMSYSPNKSRLLRKRMTTK